MTEHKTLAAALAAFQADLPGVGKGSVNPHLMSRYADLADMSKAILPALAAQGLAFVSAPTMTENGFVLAYSLLHGSGERIDGQYPLNASMNDQQKGSAITYARRYALGAVTGVAADEDDDGNAASQQKPVAEPAGWQQWIADAQTLDQLNAIYQQANGQGWASPAVMKALSARKKAVNDALANAAAAE